VPKVEPYVPPGNYELPAVAGKSDGFIVLSSLGFLILFTERGLYAHLTDGQRSATVAAIILALSAVVVFVGFLASFYLPGRLMPEHDQTRWIPHTLNFLVGQMVIAVTCMLVAGAIAIGLYVYLVYPNLLAIAWLLRDGFLYVALGALVYQGFVLFVRYLGFLYQTGGAARRKVITFEVGATAFILIVGLYQYTVDTVQILAARPEQGLLALHLTTRDIWLALMIALIYGWQIGRAGDH